MSVLFAGRGRDGPRRRRAILNLGGIANLTVLDDDPARVFGFDTGPANAPLDRLARRLSDGALACDRDGQLARSGRVNESLLADLLEHDPFLARRPPKSTGFEMYGDAFVARAAARHGGFDADLMASLTEFVARIGRVGPGASAEARLARGGGRRGRGRREEPGPDGADRRAGRAGPVRRSDELGVPSDAREAMAFAVLADMTLRGLPAMPPPGHGCATPKLLGKLSFP